MKSSSLCALYVARSISARRDLIDDCSSCLKFGKDNPVRCLSTTGTRRFKRMPPDTNGSFAFAVISKIERATRGGCDYILLRRPGTVQKKPCCEQTHVL